MKIGKLKFNDKTAESLGVFVSGAGTYNAAEEDVVSYEVPGRNGDILISNNRYKNIEVTYPAFIPADFEQRVQAVRNWMRSARSYARIEDNYDLLHFRMGVGKGILSFSPANQNRISNCQLVFNCKPQRFLYSGEEDFTPGEWGPSETFSGEVVEFENPGNKVIKSLKSEVHYTQDLNGYTKPWPGGAGKNMVDVAGGTYTGNVALFTGLPTGVTLTASADISDVEGEGGKARIRLQYVLDGNTTYSSNAQIESGRSVATLEIPAGAENVAIWAQRNSSATSYTMNNIQVEVGSTATDYEPYANICPIVGKTGLTVYVSPTTEPTGATTYPVTWQTEAGTVGIGELDVVSGVLTVTHEIWVLDGTQTYTQNGADIIAVANENKYKIAQTPKSSQFDGIAPGSSSGLRAGQFRLSANLNSINLRFGAEKTVSEWTAELAVTPVQLLMQPATPVTYQLAGQQVELLDDTNNIWSDAGDVTVEVAENPNVLVNPTLFEARPLITLTNPTQGATVTAGIYTLTCLEAYSGTVTIDCENQNIFSGPQNLNNKWSGSFPVLKPGKNSVAFSGVTGSMKPRWWEL